MPSTPSPLLAEGDDAGAPLLSSGPLVVEDSPLERLAAQPNPTPLAGMFSLHTDEPSSGSPRTFFPAHQGRNQSAASDSSATTIVAGAFCLMQITFVWGSYLSSSWFDTHISATLDWQRDYLPFLNGLTDANVKSTTIPSIFVALEGAEQHAATLALILTALLIPCLCMVLCPTWTHNDHEDRKQIQRKCQDKSLPRILFEPLVRLSLAGIYIIVLLDMGVSYITFSGNDGTDSTISVYNRTQSGMVAYALGMSCAIAVLVVLRAARTKRQDRYEAMVVASQSPSERRRSHVPPSNAFLLPWKSRNSALQARQEQQHQTDQTEPLLDNDGAGSTASRDRDPVGRSEFPMNNNLGLSLFQKLCLYEAGIISVLLWLPALFLPSIKLNFAGLASEFMTNTSFQLRLCDLPVILWSNGRSSGAKFFISLAMQLVIVGSTILIPFIATALAVVVCMGSMSSTTSKHQTKKFRNYLSWIHPALCGVVFALGLFLAIPAFQPISSRVIDHHSAGLCPQLEDAIDESCLQIIGQHTLGSWLLLAQAFALEIFVFLTVQWCGV